MAAEPDLAVHPRTELRIGDAERDRMSAALQEHFAQGRLTREELDERLAAALSARTWGDLRGLTRDLPEPTGLPGPPPRPRGGPAYGPAYGPAFGYGPAFRWGGPPWAPPHRPPGPFAPVIAIGFVLTLVLAGPKALLLIWPLIALLAFHRRRAWRRRYGNRPPDR